MNQERPTPKQRVRQRRTERWGDPRDAAYHRVLRAFAKNCVSDLFLTVRQAVVEWIEHGDDFLETIELVFAERLVGVKKIERAAACRRSKPLSEERREVSRIVVDRLGDRIPERLLLLRDAQSIMEIFNAGGRLVERRHQRSLASRRSSSIYLFCQCWARRGIGKSKADDKRHRNDAADYHAGPPITSAAIVRQTSAPAGSKSV